MEKIYLKIYCVVSIVSEYLFDSAVLSCETTTWATCQQDDCHKAVPWFES